MTNLSNLSLRLHSPFPPCDVKTRRSPDDFAVPFGQMTFDAEGSEVAGPYFSRTIHWPGGASGVTIGRGYDLGQRSRKQVFHELTYSGVPPEVATALSAAAGLRGEAARRFVFAHQRAIPAISPLAQREIFEQITTPETVQDLKRILSKSTLSSLDGRTTWDALDPRVRELLFDLRYRGDYTQKTRELIHPLIEQGALEEIAALMRDTNLWLQIGVPADRIARRATLFDCDGCRTPKLCA